MNIDKLADKYEDYIIKMRRHFHMNPELSKFEYKTSETIQEELDKLDIPYEVYIETGVIGRIKGAKPGKTVLLRADIDALEVQEANDHEYKSQVDGVMHACGHDAHIAMLLGAAHMLKEVQEDLAGEVILFFQPAEELASGAKDLMAASGIMDEVDAAFGEHVWQDLEVGQVSVEAGPRMAAADYFSIDVKGKSGHGSMPNQTIDALLAASAIVINLQQMSSRNVSPLDPFVITIGKLESGTRFNVISGSAFMEGTIRVFNNDIWQETESMVKRIAENTAAAYGARAQVHMDKVFGPTINNEVTSRIAQGAAEKITGAEVVEYEKTTGGEDFSYIAREVPSTFAFVGIRNDERGINSPHHSETFDLDEKALLIGAKLHAQFAIDFLNSED